jgi:hypothetical protein
MEKLAHYFAGLPNGQKTVRRVVDYAWKFGNGKITLNILSNATRHSLYEDVLYNTKKIDVTD